MANNLQAGGEKIQMKYEPGSFTSIQNQLAFGSELHGANLTTSLPKNIKFFMENEYIVIKKGKKRLISSYFNYPG